MYLVHHGIKGQKWGIRHDRERIGRSSKHELEKKKGLSDDQKKWIKRGVAVAGTVLIAYGSYKIASSPKFGSMVAKGIKKVRKESGPEVVRKKTGNKIDLDLQYFASHKVKNYPFKFRNKKEAAIVQSEFMPKSISREDMTKDILAKSINIDDQGAYTYLAKNQDGKGAFRVFKRIKIKDSATGILERNKYGK